MKALITGITGQDGSYLAELLLSKGYEVYGGIRRSASPNLWRIKHILDKIHVVELDLLDGNSIYKAVADIHPNEIYNLAALAFVPTSWIQPELTFKINTLGVIKFLDAIKDIDRKIKFYQASTSEMFGNTEQFPQNEKTAFHPTSPYSVSKVAAHFAVMDYRDKYDLFACCGILFNHESPRRGLEFVTRKITNAVARINLGLENSISLGNLDAKRDWGYALEYVEAMYLMLQKDRPDNYIIATEESHSVEEFLQYAFAYVGLDYREYYKINPAYLRANDVNIVQADMSYAKKALGWQPKTSLKSLIEMMVQSDLEYEQKKLK